MLFYAKTLAEIRAFDIESAAFRASSKFAGKASRATFAVDEGFRACKSTSGRKEKKKKGKRGGIYVYNRNSGVSRGETAARKGEERVWLATAKLAENRGEFTSVHTALATMRNIIKARRDERYWNVSRRGTNGK